MQPCNSPGSGTPPPLCLAAALALPAAAQEQAKPNILFIVSDDTGYGDLGPYGGGAGPRHADAEHRPARRRRDDLLLLLRPAELHPRPRRDADRAHPEPQRHDHRRLPGPGRRPAGGGMDARLGAEDRGYQTYFTGKWHLGEADYALPNAQGYDEMKYVGLYHLNAYTYADPTWFPDMDPALREMFEKVTKGALSGNAGGPVTEDFKINGQYVDTPVIDGKEGVVGIPFFDGYVEKAALEFLDEAAQDPGHAVLHQRQLHEGAPAEHAGAGVPAEVAGQVEVRRLGRRARHPHRPASWRSSRSSASTRTRWSSTPPTTAPGRTSTPTPATPRSAAPRARSARAATACRRSPSGRARSRRTPRTTRSSAAST